MNNDQDPNTNPDPNQGNGFYSVDVEDLDSVIAAVNHYEKNNQDSR